MIETLSEHDAHFNDEIRGSWERVIDQVIECMDQTENKKLIVNDGNSMLITTVKDLASIMRDQGLIDKMIVVEDLFDWNGL